MNKILIDVSRDSDTTHAFTKGSLLVHDGKEFHRTTVRELYSELMQEFLNFKVETENKIKELESKNKEFYEKYTEQNSKLIPILEKIIKEKQ